MLRQLFKDCAKALILFFLLFIPGLTICMNTPSGKNFSVCDEIKKLDPNGSENEYMAFAKKLESNKLDTCECYQELMRKKMDKAKLGLKVALNISDAKYTEINEIIDKVENRASAGLVEFPQLPELPAEKRHALQNPAIRFSSDPALWQQIQQQYLKWSSQTKPHWKPQATEEQLYGINFSQPERLEIIILSNKTPFIGTTVTTKPFTWNLHIGVPYFFYLLTNNNATLLIQAIQHELAHLKYLDNLTYALFMENAHTKIATDSPLFKKLNHAFEHRADQIPTACGCSADSLSLVQEFHNIPGVSVDGLEHPSDEKRIQHLMRIHNLKKAEEKLQTQKLSKQTPLSYSSDDFMHIMHV